MQLANGNVPVERSVLPTDPLAATDKTVAEMMQLAEGQYGMRSPRIRALAINIVRKAGVKEKDYYGEMKAIHEWVKANIRYMRDPVNQETLSTPEELAFNTRAGDCDDMTILEIALLGSIGIKAWPVVIGVEHGVPSHVYLQARIPPGRHRKAGQVISLDPIMKEWKAGEEAPAHRVKIRHEYRDGDYQNGIQRQREGVSMDRNQDLGDAYAMLPGIGAYATAPSYLDTEDSQAQRLLRPDLSVTTGSIANTSKVGVGLEGIDGMFSGMGQTMDVGIATPASARDSLFQLGPKGPLTALSAEKATHLVPSVQPQRISGKKYEAPAVARALAATRGKIPAQVGKPETVVRVHTDEGMFARKPKTAREEANEIRGLAAVISELQNSFLPGIGALGEEDKKEVAEQGAVVAWWARFKARAAAARAAWAQENARQARAERLPAAALQAECAAMQERKNAQDATELAKAAGAVSFQMARTDPEVATSVAQTFEALEAQEGEAQAIDGLLGLSADDLRAGKANMRRGLRMGFKGGRRSAPMVVESNDDGPLTMEEREQIQSANQGRIVAGKMQQLRQAANRGKRKGLARCRCRDSVMAPIPVSSVQNPGMQVRNEGFMGWLRRVFGFRNDRSPAPVFVESLPTKRPVSVESLPTKRPVSVESLPTKRPVLQRRVPTKRPVSVESLPTKRPVLQRRVPTKRPVLQRRVPMKRPARSLYPGFRKRIRPDTPISEAAVRTQELAPASEDAYMPQAIPDPTSNSIEGLGFTHHLSNPLVLGAAGLGLWWFLSRKK